MNDFIEVNPGDIFYELNQDIMNNMDNINKSIEDMMSKSGSQKSDARSNMLAWLAKQGFDANKGMKRISPVVESSVSDIKNYSSIFINGESSFTQWDDVKRDWEEISFSGDINTESDWSEEKIRSIIEDKSQSGRVPSAKSGVSRSGNIFNVLMDDIQGMLSVDSLATHNTSNLLDSRVITHTPRSCPFHIASFRFYFPYSITGGGTTVTVKDIEKLSDNKISAIPISGGINGMLGVVVNESCVAIFNNDTKLQVTSNSLKYVMGISGDPALSYLYTGQEPGSKIVSAGDYINSTNVKTNIAMNDANHSGTIVRYTESQIWNSLFTKSRPMYIYKYTMLPERYKASVKLMNSNDYLLLGHNMSVNLTDIEITNDIDIQLKTVRPQVVKCKKDELTYLVSKVPLERVE